MSERHEGDPDTSLDETLDEHAACMQLVGELERCLDRRPEDPKGWLVELVDRTTRLGRALREHVQGEEAGPMFRRLPIRHPRLADRLGQLKAEHPLMLEDLESVLVQAGKLKDPRTFELRELNARVQLLVARIRRHEAAENELLIEAHWDEIGVGD